MEALGEAEVAEWQTRQVQDLVHAKVGVGSSPTFGTTRTPHPRSSGGFFVEG